MNTLFIQPLDVLVLRGNKLFGDAGSHGEAHMPPWPSVAAGALRSRMLVDHNIDPAAFARGKATLPAGLATVRGSVEAPGSFRLRHFGLARCGPDNRLEALHPLPADIVVESKTGTARQLRPAGLPAGLASSYPLPLTPIMAQPEPSKPASGLWLTAEGFAAWQAGHALDSRHWLKSSDLWQNETRLGIALDPTTRSAADSQLYTTETVALGKDIGFVAQVDAAAGWLPTGGLLRFGGDGHAASVAPCELALPTPDFEALAAAGRFRLLLTSPGIFPQGWQLPVTDDGGRWRFDTASARLACASVPRLETLSGWDLARHSPKPAVRVVPAGSVYWLDDFQGNADDLRQLFATGLPLADAARRAEGFNAIQLAAW